MSNNKFKSYSNNIIKNHISDNFCFIESQEASMGFVFINYHKLNTDPHLFRPFSPLFHLKLGFSNCIQILHKSFWHVDSCNRTRYFRQNLNFKLKMMNQDLMLEKKNEEELRRENQTVWFDVDTTNTNDKALLLIVWHFAAESYPTTSVLSLPNEG